MHFTTLFILKGRTLKDISTYEVERLFNDRFCYNCGETRPRYRYWCDWFQIGGRWNDSGALKSENGLYGENGVGGHYKEPTPSIVEIKDLTDKINRELIYAVATLSRVYVADEYPEKYNELLDKIDNKKIKGVVALIDCHD